MANRFDFVPLDEVALDVLHNLKNLFIELEDEAEGSLMAGRSKALVMTKLEEAFMWVGKAIRDEQILRIEREPTRTV